MAVLATGEVFAGYRIENVAGRGGMGVVYRATDLALDRPVALKLIAAELASDAGFRRRFGAESRTAASLDHPNVIPIFAAGEHDDALYIVMRYVEGENLATVIEAEGRLPLRRVLHLITQVAAALDAAHAAGLVHRDVTPANIFLTPNDHVYLMDFGLTKRRLKDADETQTGHLMGTPNYVAPERIRGGEVDHRTDIYALGCVTFHAITGRVPFPMEEQEAKLWAHMSEPPPLVSSVAPDVPSAIDEVVGRAMAKEPSNRFGSAGEMAQALAVAVDPDMSVHAERPATWWRGSRIAAAMIAPFSLAILAGTVIAAAILDLLPLGALAAIVAYAAAVVVALREDDRASRHAVDAEATRVETENE